MEDTNSAPPPPPPPSKPEPEPNSAPSEPEAESNTVTQTKPVPPEPAAQSENAPPEPVAQVDDTPPKPAAHAEDAVPPEPAAQKESVPTEPSAQPNAAPPASDTTARPQVPRMAADGEPPAKKRKPEDLDFHNSTYFKIRTVVKDLRPLFVQVSQNSNSPNSNVALDILKEINTVLELAKQLRNDLNPTIEPNRTTNKSSTIKDESMETCQEKEKKGEATQTDQASDLSKTDSSKLASESKDVPRLLEEGFKGTYVVGGSPIGWNFLVYPGTQPVYYGRARPQKQAPSDDNQEKSSEITPLGLQE